VRAALVELDAGAGDEAHATVDETSTSPGPAVAATRAPMWTAIPPTSSPMSSISACVHAGADLQPDCAYVVDDRLSAANGPGWSVEGREETVTGGINLTTTKSD
jgi:hypothetical protein